MDKARVKQGMLPNNHEAIKSCKSANVSPSSTTTRAERRARIMGKSEPQREIDTKSTYACMRIILRHTAEPSTT